MGLLGELATGVITGAIGDAYKSDSVKSFAYDLTHRAFHGETIEERRLRNHDLERGVFRSYLKAIMEIYQLCLVEIENNPNEYRNEEIKANSYKISLKVIEKDIKLLKGKNDFDLNLNFHHLQFLMAPDSTGQGEFNELNSLLKDQMPSRYKIDSPLFWRFAEENLYNFMQKYFCYELKYTNEVKDMFTVHSLSKIGLAQESFQKKVLDFISEQGKMANSDEENIQRFVDQRIFMAIDELKSLIISQNQITINRNSDKVNQFFQYYPGTSALIKKMMTIIEDALRIYNLDFRFAYQDFIEDEEFIKEYFLTDYFNQNSDNRGLLWEQLKPLYRSVYTEYGHADGPVKVTDALLYKYLTGFPNRVNHYQTYLTLSKTIVDAIIRTYNENRNTLIAPNFHSTIYEFIKEIEQLKQIIKPLEIKIKNKKDEYDFYQELFDNIPLRENFLNDNDYISEVEFYGMGHRLFALMKFNIDEEEMMKELWKFAQYKETNNILLNISDEVHSKCMDIIQRVIALIEVLDQFVKESELKLENLKLTTPVLVGDDLF